jgi:DNA-binding GntR family transcriptional regulator
MSPRKDAGDPAAGGRTPRARAAAGYGSPVPAERAPRHAPVDVESLVQIGYEAIRSAIVAGQYAPGEHLVESRIAEELATSRAPIREALRQLEREGIIEQRPRRGFFVREITAQDFVDIYNLRIAIECAAAQLVARRKPSLSTVEDTVELLHQAARRGDVGATVDLELLAHQQICDASGNAYLASLFRSVSGPARMALALDDAAYDDLEDAATEHVPLLAALRSGDPARAAIAIYEHIVASVSGVLDRLGGNAKDLLPGPPIPAATSRSKARKKSP